MPSKGVLKALHKIAVAMPPNRALDMRKFLRWEKNKQGELEVLSKRPLASYKIGIFSGGIRTSVFACAAPVWRGACPMGFVGNLHLAGQQEGTAV